MSDISLFCADALDILRDLPSDSIDAAIFDPPYKTISGGSNEGKSGKWSRPSGILEKNDGRIFAHNDIRPETYLPEVFRVLREDAHVYLMTNVYNLTERDLFSAVRAAGFKVHNLLPWRKNNATPNRWYMKDVEYTIFARKGRAFSINELGSRTSQDVFPHPLDWDNVSSPKNHPTEKPVNLMRTFVLNSTQPGEIVLDPFMGTGATGVACAEEGRRFIGIEMDETYAKKAAERLGSPLAIFQPETDPEIEEMLG